MLQKLLAIILLLGAGTTTAWSQSRSCGTMEHVQRLEKNRPNLRQQLKQQARMASFTGTKRLSGNTPLADVITIPVVVHVVYNEQTQNISDAQIASQIEVLNKDFRRLNTDAGKTPAMFKGVAADTEIEFVLAKRTPDGETTTGITRTQTSVTDFAVDDKMKFSSSGGKDAWNTEKYLNIWVVHFAAFEDVLGYGQFPNSGSPLTDGVVVDYRYFGTTGTATAPFNKGRTTTHEVGHWLNLFHIWGDEDCGDDAVADTPTQETENVGCPSTFPLPSCDNVSDMYMNYMDYTDDGCMNLFTAGQKAVMRSALINLRPGLLTSKGAMEVEVPVLDAALIGVTAPAKVLCQNSFAPAIVLRNRGSQTLSNVQLQYRLDNGTPQTYTWTGTLPSYQNVTVTLPVQTAGAGQRVLSVAIVSRNNSASDANAGNDQINYAFQVHGRTLPLNESFESAAFPPAGWELLNPDATVTWANTTKAAKSGSASVFMDNYNYESAGQVDELVLPPLDLTSRTSPILSFHLAYALYSPNGYSDTLEVLVSTDCGATYQRVYRKFDASLSTTTPAYTDVQFVPKAGQWRLEAVDLSAFTAATTAIIKFRHITDYENNLYLDDIKVDGGPLGIAEDLAKQAVKVSPNPTSGVVQVESPEALITEVQVLNAIGKVVQAESYGQSKKRSLQLELHNHPNGVYLVRLLTDKGTVVRRIVLVR
ncbi:M43 family zinc metalloprotease [Rufibacter roseus]|uniref:M43 family zinc metalloprotease n=1 Tax=Rufibacter roseus TaxID=1567108 RepID=A0ABW2DHD6_9BACT|nr:M43 family zinc metalloprotease [Rufibacter roseus]